MMRPDTLFEIIRRARHEVRRSRRLQHDAHELTRQAERLLQQFTERVSAGSRHMAKVRFEQRNLRLRCYRGSRIQ